jgi:acyl-CoA thioesterase-1
VAFSQIQVRRDSTANWSAFNPVLALGEPGYDYQLHTLRIGDGTSAYSTLASIIIAASEPIGLSAGTRATVSRATFAHGRVWAFLGDSITAGTGASPLYGYVDVALRIAGSARVREVQNGSINAGVPGNTSQGMLARFDTDVTAKTPLGLHIQAGVNDAAQGVPFATYMANIKAIVAKGKALGIPITIGTVTPQAAGTATDPIRTLMGVYNAWIRLWAPSAGLIIADTYNAIVDLATGDTLTANNSDGTHPNNLGHALMGKAVAAAIVASTPAQKSWFVNAKSIISLLPNPLMVGGSASTLPTSWTDATYFGAIGTVPAFSTVADSSGALTGGSWLQVAWNTAAASTRFIASTMVGNFPSSTNVLVCGKLQVDDVAGWAAAVAAGTAKTGLYLINNSTGVNVATLLENVDVTLPGPFASRVTVPAMAVGDSLALVLRLTAPTGIQVNIRIGQLDMFNMTALGLVE